MASTIPSAPIESRGRGLIIAAGALVVVLAALAAVVVFGGFLGGGGGTRTAAPTVVAGSVAPSGSGAVGPSAITSGEPGVTEPPSPGDTPEPTVEPSAAATEEPSSGPTPEPTEAPTPTSRSGSRFQCETQTYTDPSPTRWTISQAAWKPVSGFDRFTLTLVRTPTKAPQPAELTVELVPMDEVESRFGVPPPAIGDVAIVIEMDDPIRFKGTIERDEIAMTALRSLRVSGTGSGPVYAVLGVAGEGCFDLDIPNWDDFADPPSPSELIVEIARP